MGLIAAVLIPIILFYWISFCITVLAWLKAISHLCFGQFIRSAVWFSVGCGMLFWWTDLDIDFDTWLHGSAMIVGVGALGTFMRYYRNWKRKQMLALPTMPAWTPPKIPANDNLVKLSLHVKREG